MVGNLRDTDGGGEAEAGRAAILNSMRKWKAEPTASISRGIGLGL